MGAVWMVKFSRMSELTYSLNKWRVGWLAALGIMKSRLISAYG